MNTMKSMLLAACVMLLAGCPSGVNPSALGNSTITYTSSADGHLIAQVFDLTHTAVPASAAAKKIASYEGKSIGGLTFEEAKALAYDDKTGTFTVKIKAAGDNLNIDKELSFSGFKTPYADPAFSLKTVDMNFDTAIEYNMPLDEFIKKAHEKSAAVTALSFTDPKAGEITLGDGDHYRLTAQLENKGGMISINPVYTVKYAQKKNNEAETTVEEVIEGVFSHLKGVLTQPYFSKHDVFTYLMNKTGESVIKVSSDMFASQYYAFAKHLNVTPGSLVNDREIQNIMARYDKAGGQFNMKIDTALVHPKHSGITADDYTGSLEVTYCIAEKEQIAEMLDPEDPRIKLPSVTKKLSVSGFNTVNSGNIESLFKFTITVDNTQDARNKWLAKEFKNHRLLSAHYDSETACEVYAVHNPLAKNKSSQCYLEVNGKDAEDVFAYNDVLFFSKTLTGKNMFIEYIFLDKEKDSNSIKIRMKFLGSGEEIVLEKIPE